MCQSRFVRLLLAQRKHSLFATHSMYAIRRYRAWQSQQIPRQGVRF
jgi:hypothetical protein